MSMLNKYPSEMIGEHNFVNELDRYNKLSETNPYGYDNMLEFSKRVLEKLQNFIPVPINFIVRGKPSATFDVKYIMNYSKDYNNFIAFVLYPAGFKFRYEDICKDFEDELIQDIKDKLNLSRKFFNFPTKNQKKIQSKVCANKPICKNASFLYYGKCRDCLVKEGKLKE